MKLNLWGLVLFVPSEFNNGSTVCVSGHFRGDLRRGGGLSLADTIPLCS